MTQGSKQIPDQQMDTLGQMYVCKHHWWRCRVLFTSERSEPEPICRYWGHFSWSRKLRVYLCLWAEHRAVALNGFPALQPPDIVRTDSLNVMHVSKYSGGPAPSDTPALARRVATPHSHFLLHSSSGLGQSRWHGDPSVTQSGRTRWPPHNLMGVCVCVSWPNWRGSKPRGTGPLPPPPAHTCFTLHHLFQLSPSFVFNLNNRLLEKNAQNIRNHTTICWSKWLSACACPENALCSLADWFPVRLHNKRKASHLLHSSLYQRALIHYIVCVVFFACTCVRVCVPKLPAFS